MKIRLGFVSNSSSASFIITFKTRVSSKRVEKVIRISDKWLSEQWDQTEREDWDWSKSKLLQGQMVTKTVPCDPWKNKIKKEKDVYKISVDTSMLNDHTDIPAWKFVRALSEDKIPDFKFIELLQTGGDDTSISDVIDFDKRCWEYREYVVGESLGKKDSDVAKAVKKQESVEIVYLEYLADIGTDLPEEDVLKLAKFQLNK